MMIDLFLDYLIKFQHPLRQCYFVALVVRISFEADPGFPSNSNLSSHIINTFNTLSAFNTNNTDSTIRAFNPLTLTPRTITDTIPNSKITGNVLPAFVDLYIDIISSSPVPQDTINTYAIASNTINSNGTDVNTNINTSVK